MTKQQQTIELNRNKCIQKWMNEEKTEHKNGVTYVCATSSNRNTLDLKVCFFLVRFLRMAIIFDGFILLWLLYIWLRPTSTFPILPFHYRRQSYNTHMKSNINLMLQHSKSNNSCDPLFSLSYSFSLSLEHKKIVAERNLYLRK